MNSTIFLIKLHHMRKRTMINIFNLNKKNKIHERKVHYA